jgi:hypothetical protein
MWNIDLIQIQECYEKLKRGGHIGEGYGKRRKLRR